MPKNIWEKLEDESALYFSYFQIYRDLEPIKRTVPNAVATFFDLDPHADKDEIESKATHWRNISRANDWATRASEYDKYKDESALALRQQIEETNLQALQSINNALYDVILRGLKRIDVDSLSPNQLLKMIETYQQVNNSIRQPLVGSMTYIDNRKDQSNPENSFPKEVLEKAGQALGIISVDNEEAQEKDKEEDQQQTE